MLPKQFRLNLKTDFKWVASGTRIDTPFAVIFLKEGENLTARVGIALSSKNFRKAHDRNKARRLISAAFESLFTTLKPNLNIVALPKSAVLEVKSTEVKKTLEEYLKKSGVL